MADEKIYYPEVIDDTPYPNGIEEGDFATTQKTGNETYSSEKIKSQSFPARKVAHEVIGSALNTKSKKILGVFQFTETGALQVGKYINGVSGEIKIAPSGIVARNTAGDTTFAIDGETGDAIFAGIVQTGTLISGLVIVGDNNIRIDGEAKQIIVNDGENDRILIGFQTNGF